MMTAAGIQNVPADAGATRAHVWAYMATPQGRGDLRAFVGQGGAFVVDGAVERIIDPTRNWALNRFDVNDDADFQLYIDRYILPGHMVQEDVLRLIGAAFNVNVHILMPHMTEPIRIYDLPAGRAPAGGQAGSHRPSPAPNGPNRPHLRRA